MNIEEYRNRIVKLLMSFDTAPNADLREQVLSLIPVWNEMNNMGCALLPVTVRKVDVQYHLTHPPPVFCFLWYGAVVMVRVILLKQLFYSFHRDEHSCFFILSA